MLCMLKFISVFLPSFVPRPETLLRNMHIIPFVFSAIIYKLYRYKAYGFVGNSAISLNICPLELAPNITRMYDNCLANVCFTVGTALLFLF